MYVWEKKERKPLPSEGSLVGPWGMRLLEICEFSSDFSVRLTLIQQLQATLDCNQSCNAGRVSLRVYEFCKYERRMCDGMGIGIVGCSQGELKPTGFVNRATDF